MDKEAITTKTLTIKSEPTKDNENEFDEFKKPINPATIKLETDKLPIEQNNDCDEKSNLKDIKIEKKIKIDIWKKRTVADVFDAALKRYYERKYSEVK